MAASPPLTVLVPAPEIGQQFEDRTPTTPKPDPAPLDTVSASLGDDDSGRRTPALRDASVDLRQRQPPGEPSTPTQPHDISSLAKNESQDVEMENGDVEDGSDNESITSDSQRPSKKKKGQRFFCTGFPPCQLSFTRSEHLARHIRKHTGERPFQCHCSRRFSRLDNLRQHAQTVHVNEDIPGDSLAATSTRFQRQIRTDRVRPPGSRSRSNTLGSNGGHSRGHSRNLSTSSIGSAVSSVGTPDDTRRRPQPLAMANDPASRARLTLDTYNHGNTSPGPNFNYFNHSPTGLSTPASATFSVDTGSPGFGSGMLSPTSTLSRTSLYNSNRHGRRLSVPAAPNPFQHQMGSIYPPPYFGAPMRTGNSTTLSPTNNSAFGSPTSSVFSHSRRDSETELEYRRRTWHPGTYANLSQRPATSGLSYHQTPDDHGPAISEQPAASQLTRLPGIETFDHAARQQPSPMMVDVSPRPTSPGKNSDAGVQYAPARPEPTTPSTHIDAQWHSQTQNAAQRGLYQQQPVTIAHQNLHRHSVSLHEPPMTPRRDKRNAWYGGPLQNVQPPHMLNLAHSAQRTSPEDSGSSEGVPTPSTSHVNEYHPMIINHNVAVEGYPPGATIAGEQKVVDPHGQQPAPTWADSEFQTYSQAAHPFTLQSGHDPNFENEYAQPSNKDMGRLEALVAVATSENLAVERSGM